MDFELPKVKLPDYKKIVSSIKKNDVEVTQEEIVRLKAEKERVEKERLRQEILTKIGEEAAVEIPSTLIDAELGRMKDNLRRQVGLVFNISFEDYLKKINKTEKELFDSLLQEAQKSVKNFLVLKAIQNQENVAVDQNEVMANLPKIDHVDQEKLKEYTEEIMENEKTFQFLESLLK